MIYWIVSLLLFVVRMFSWIPGTDSQLFVYGVIFAAIIAPLGIIDRRTHFFRNLFDHLGTLGWISLVVALTFFATTSVWLNVVGVIIVACLLFANGFFSKNGEKLTFAQRLRNFADGLDAREEVGSAQKQKRAWIKPARSFEETKNFEKNQSWDAPL